eukprot:TRINITY_DN67039_c5_g3_i1.p1 TRINITY_DN67039_c5_g3~~TRINITY_DN67039_c5_g3_i1.p1  ORF type:complete len:465 (-),score=64.78 TRINITY_DN67039_c5_g3_i1:935-2125(-)
MTNMIANNVVEGASVYKLCTTADETLNTELQATYRKAVDANDNPVIRGVAFPSCFSVNDIACYFSPEETDPDIILHKGDILHIEMAGHIDGYIATVAHTVIVGYDPEEQEQTERTTAAKQVMHAAYLTALAAARLMRPGNTNDQVTDLIARMAHALGLHPAFGVCSHRMKRYDEMGEQVILQRERLTPKDSQLAETVTFEPDQVWGLDVVFMNGSDSMLRARDYKTTIYKRSEVMKAPRVKATQYVLGALRQINEAGQLPFAVHNMEDVGKAHLGCAVLAKESLLDTFQPLCTKPGQILARYKWTITIQGRDTKRLCGLDAPAYINVKDLSQLPTELKQIISQRETQAKQKVKVVQEGKKQKVSAKKKKKSQKKKAKKTTTANNDDAEADDPAEVD